MEKSQKQLKKLSLHVVKIERAAGRIENTLANLEQLVNTLISQQPNPPPRIRT